MDNEDKTIAPLEDRSIRVPPDVYDERMPTFKYKKKPKNIKIPITIVFIHGLITLFALVALIIMLIK